MTWTRSEPCTHVIIPLYRFYGLSDYYSRSVVQQFQQSKALLYSWIGMKWVGFDSFRYDESTNILPTATEYAHSTYIRGGYSQLVSSGRSPDTHRLVPYAAQSSRAG